MWLALLATLLAQPDAAGACPTDAAVQATLAELGADQLRPEIVVVGNRMRVILRDSSGLVLGEREVETAADCHERAMQAAVLAATWAGIWSAGPTPPPPVAPAPPPAPATTKRRHEISLTALAAHDGNARALGGQLMAQTSLSRGGTWRGLVALSGLTERDRAVGPGSAGYVRMAADVGPALRWQGQTFFVEGALAGRLAWLRVQGKDLAVTHSARLLAPGLSSHLRLGLGQRTFTPFVFAGGVAWLNRYQLVLDNANARAALPRWEAVLGLGVGWAFGG